jgi:hypothetical protein
MVGAGLAERHSATREHLVDDFGDVADRAALLRGSDVEDVAVHPSRGTSIARTIASVMSSACTSGRYGEPRHARCRPARRREPCVKPNHFVAVADRDGTTDPAPLTAMTAATAERASRSARRRCWSKSRSSSVRVCRRSGGPLPRELPLRRPGSFGIRTEVRPPPHSGRSVRAAPSASTASNTRWAPAATPASTACGAVQPAGTVAARVNVAGRPLSSSNTSEADLVCDPASKLLEQSRGPGQARRPEGATKPRTVAPNRSSSTAAAQELARPPWWAESRRD